ncbi:MAG: choice-of-anchor L domain-containing protein, partial [Saprospiraceae bacterium]|nr:choice-of-anchor L domain-containing protein [Saprospiraceae bacterium]
MIRLSLLLFFVFSSFLAFPQLTVQKGYTAQQLGNNLAGANINIINPTISGDTDQYGIFSFTGNSLGLNSGVILSTGDIDDAVGPNSDDATSTDFGGPGDSDLTALAGFSTEDAVVFEFEFEVQGDELEFNFVFLSEEYNEWVNSGFNDVFAFYISGPGITGQENLAVVPGTTTPVTINSINNGSFWQFYNDNDFNPGGPPSPVNIEFDGFTTLMKARKTNLNPCSIYKLSLRIADGSDDRLDSGVLLQENSLVSNSIAVSSATLSLDTTALEGCYPATFTFNLGATAATDLNIPIRLGGTALNGVDYLHIDSIITIPAGQTSSTVIINALADGVAEGVETIELYYSPSSCAPEDTVILYINDATSITFDALGANLGCNGDTSGSIAINIAGGSAPYSVTYIDTSTGFSNTIPDSALPITGLNASTYLLRIADQYGCTADAIVVGGSFNAGQTFLPDGTGASYTSDILISGFNTGQSLNSITQINSVCATMEHSYASDLTIELIAPGGQSIQLKNVGTTGSGVNTCDLGEPIASGPVDNWSSSNTNPGLGYQYCWTNIPTYATMNDMISPTPPGPPPIHTFTTLAGNSYTDYYLPSGSYTPRQSFFGLLGTTLNGNWTLRVTDNFTQDNGYIFDWAISLQADLPDSIITLTEPIGPVISHSTLEPACGTANGAIDLTVSGNHTPFTFAWSNGETIEDITGLTAGTYTVAVTDTTSCTYNYVVNLSDSGSVTLSANVTNETCASADNGSIDLSVSGGLFTFNWSNGETNEDINGLAPGLYTVTVTDSFCLAIGNYTIDAAAPIILNAAIINENCGDQEGIIDLTVQGGAGTLN